MALKTYLNQSIARRILLAILLFSFVVTTISTAVILFSQYTNEVQEIIDDANHIIDSQIPSITETMWSVDKPFINVQLKSLTNTRTITYGAIYDEAQKVFIDSGDNLAPFNRIVEKPLYYQLPSSESPLKIGVLKLHISTTSAINHVKNNFINIIITQTVKSILISLFFLLIIHYFLTRHLQTILRYVENHMTARSTKDVLQLQRSGKNDELQVLVDAINSSKVQLESHYKALNTQKQALVFEIDQRSQAETEARNSYSQLRQILNSLTEAVFACTTDGEILLMNKTATTLLPSKYPPIHTTQMFLKDYLQLSHTPQLQKQLIDLSTLVTDKTHQINAFLIHEKDDTAPMPVHITLVSATLSEESEQIPGFIAVIRDETDRTKLKEMSYNATHDFLTGLYNRFYFTEKLKKIIKRKQSQDNCLAIIDLDKFKLVNDTYGHQAGDELLRLVATTLSKAIDSGDLLARLGGDEFTILFKGNLDSSLDKAKKIIYDIENLNFAWKEQTILISCSIGITPMEENDHFEAVQSRADKACYQVKHDGGGLIQVRYRSIESENVEIQQFKVLQNIIAALRKEAVILYAQPIIPLQNQTQQRLEVLSRMQLEGVDDISYPIQFLPLLDNHYYTPKLDLIVIKKLKTHIKSLADHNWQLNINLSPLSLVKPSHTESIISFLEEIQPSQGQICFEITETTLIKQKDHVLNFMEKAREYGAIFGLDDFGSGYASFGLLNDFSFEIIKVDGNMVHNIDKDKTLLSLLKSIISTAKTLGAITVAERASSDAVIDILKQIGVDYVQSNHTHPPEELRFFYREK